jgi:hypothetical protein
MVAQHVGAAGQLANGLGALRVHRDGRAQHVSGGAQQLLSLSIAAIPCSFERCVEVRGADDLAVDAGAAMGS